MSWEQLILRTGGLMSARELDELAYWAEQAPGPALEVGHYTGLSTAALLSSLPADLKFITIDDHSWRDVPTGLFMENIAPFVGERYFVPMFDDYRGVLAKSQETLGFVFYDGPHSHDDCDKFWSLVEPLLQPECLFLFDDADWESMQRMGENVEAAGFVRMNRQRLWRHRLGYTTGGEQADFDLAKRHPDSYTLDVWKRNGE